MNTEPESGFDRSKTPERHARLRYDPTISLGHILTFVTLIVAGFGVYNTMDKRITVLEEQRRLGDERIAERERFMRDSVNEMRADVKDVQRSIYDLARALTSATDRQQSK
ncbi:MAG: hypothetical protein IAE92_05850 [Burkholderiaceae bacterium]|nr:hypothetical protein [Burkholderiaceae bacterium]